VLVDDLVSLGLASIPTPAEAAAQYGALRAPGWRGIHRRINLIRISFEIVLNQAPRLSRLGLQYMECHIKLRRSLPNPVAIANLLFN
jgi:hypothetical protein